MQPISFEESNCNYENHHGFTLNGINIVSAFKGESKDGIPIVVTCWKMTEEELEEFQRTGKIWILSLGTELPLQQPLANKPIERL